MQLFQPRRSRSAFTLVELMVSVTLIIFIMTILSEAFKAGIDSFRELRAAGDLAERLRSANNIIRKDLASEHFDITDQDPIGLSGPYLRDQRLDMKGWMPPRRGFVRIWQFTDSTITSPPANVIVNENSDSDGLISSRANNHILHFTSKLRANQPGEYFTGLVPPFGGMNHPLIDGAPDVPTFSDKVRLLYATRWAEIALFLVPNGTYTDSANSIPLHSLHRRVRVRCRSCSGLEGRGDSKSAG